MLRLINNHPHQGTIAASPEASVGVTVVRAICNGSRPRAAATTPLVVELGTCMADVDDGIKLEFTVILVMVVGAIRSGSRQGSAALVALTGTSMVVLNGGIGVKL